MTTMIETLEPELTGADHRRFIDVFQAYITHDDRTDLVVHLDDVCEWLGVGALVAEKLVYASLQDGVEFTINDFTISYLAEGDEGVYLTLDGFKKLCVATDTVVSRRALEYLVAMEHEYE